MKKELCTSCVASWALSWRDGCGGCRLGASVCGDSGVSELATGGGRVGGAGTRQTYGRRISAQQQRLSVKSTGRQVSSACLERCARITSSLRCCAPLGRAVAPRVAPRVAGRPWLRNSWPHAVRLFESSPRRRAERALHLLYTRTYYNAARDCAYSLTGWCAACILEKSLLPASAFCFSVEVRLRHGVTVQPRKEMTVALSHATMRCHHCRAYPWRNLSAITGVSCADCSASTCIDTRFITLSLTL